MRRALIVLVLVPAIVAAVGAQAAFAAPQNAPGSFELTHPCGDSMVTYVLGPGLGIKSWGLDSSGELNGREYILKSTELHGYVGDLPTEPIGEEPEFTYTKSFGERAGQEVLACTNRDTFVHEGQIMTVFFTLELALIKS